MPQIYFEKVKSFCNAELFFWHIKENCDELSELIADNGILLAEAESRFKSRGRQREWLAVRALWQQTPYKGVDILYQDNGKPYLAECPKFISISHTQEYVAIAVSDNPVGLDIESVNRDALAVARAFLKQSEIDYLLKEENPSRQALDLWCAKESAFKLASDKVVVLKEIGITKNADSYIVDYPDGTIAKCTVCLCGDILLSVANYNY